MAEKNPRTLSGLSPLSRHLQDLDHVGCKYVLLGGVYPGVRARSRCMRLPPSTLPGITRGPTRSGARQVSSSDSAPAQVTSPVLLIDYFLYKNCL